MRTPLAIELFCGSFGWSAGWLELGGRAIGFDIEHLPHHGPVPAGAMLVLQDVLTLEGSQFKDADIIFASPPCQEYSKYAMPFGALWQEHDRMDDDGSPPGNYLHKPCPRNFLFERCRIIQREASQAAGRYIPMIIENVRGAAKFVGKSDWNFGSFHLYGDVPALMPINLKRGMKGNPDGTGHPSGSWFAVADSAQGDRRDGVKQLHSRGNNQSAGRHRMGLGEGQKTTGHVNKRDGHTHTRHLTNQAESDAVNGTKQSAGNGDWFSKEARAGGASARYGSKSNARKAASAQIAKIPLALSQHIAQVYFPRKEAVRLSA